MRIRKLKKDKTPDPSYNHSANINAKSLEKENEQLVENYLEKKLEIAILRYPLKNQPTTEDRVDITQKRIELEYTAAFAFKIVGLNRSIYYYSINKKNKMNT